MENNQIRVIFPDSYPITMQNMHRPPKKLWMRGKWPDPDGLKFLCVVGSRHPSRYGEEAVAKLVLGLKGYPISIVSGLAIGIDGMAHEAALEAGLHCVAFPGSGLDWDVVYPYSNEPLARKIIEAGGALLSEYAPECRTAEFMFPTRNRLMAGISHATLIVEAGHGSGSLMTARYAEDFDRDVLAVPGSIFADHSYGAHMLLHRGAGLVASSDDLLEALGFVPPAHETIAKRRLEALDPLSRRIIDVLRRGEISSDALIETLGVEPQEASARLSSLELEGLIEADCALLRLSP